MSLGICQFKSKLNPGPYLIDNCLTRFKLSRMRKQGSLPVSEEMEIALKGGKQRRVCKICAKWMQSFAIITNSFS
jgi:hypothetical protein